uniref:Uncharacterized protein n=1 Tax=uncultured marine virus TaxID=186617 RepID=A0A0F7L6P2_9VIRU|nr:hypothetical protein [uncultured marine virus]
MAMMPFTRDIWLAPSGIRTSAASISITNIVLPSYGYVDNIVMNCCRSISSTW